MGTDSDDKIPLTKRELPSVTRETKARFQQLLDIALRNEAGDTQTVPLPRPRGRKDKKNKLAKSEAVNSQSEDDSQSLRSSSASDDRNNRRSPANNIKKRSHKNRITLLAQVHSNGKINSDKSDSQHSNENSTGDLHSSEDDLLTDIEKMKPPRIIPRKQLKKNSTAVINSDIDGNKNTSDENRLDSNLKNVESTVIESQKTIGHKEDNNISEKKAKLIISGNTTDANDSDASKASVKVKTPVPLPRRSRSKPTSPKSNIPLDIGSMSDGNYMPLVKDAVISNLKNPIKSGVISDKSNFCSTPLKINTNYSNTVFSFSNDNEYEPEDDDTLIKKKRAKKKRKPRKYSSHNNEDVGSIELKHPPSTGTSTTASSLETLRKRSCSGERNFSRKHSIPDDTIFGITIHRTDVLQQHPLLRHPMVRVYIVNIASGQLINKSDPNRPASFCDENISYILPIMTHPFDLKQQRSLVPAWEEVLVFNEFMTHIVVPETVLFFEIIDFVNFTSGSIRYRRLGRDSAWHRVAWAFLKLIAINGEINTEKKLRLQLYKPKNKTTDSTKPTVPAVYEWWKEGLPSFTKYPSTLYVTVGRVTPPQAPLTPNLRSRVVLQSERGSAASIVALQTDINSGNNDEAGDNEVTVRSQHTDSSIHSPTSVIWSRLPAQSCKLTNNKHVTIPIAPSGGFAIEFSHNGLYLACASSMIIQVYDVPHYKNLTVIASHQGLIYKLRWSVDDICLISSSADCTACVWDLRKKIPSPQVLAHPSFVYCADFVPHFVRRTIISGCCDGTVRVWNRDKPALYRLAQEMPGHTGFVNALCFSSDNRTFYTGDSVGDIRMWQYNTESAEWSCVRDIKVREIRGVVINNLSLHAGGNRMLLHTRDNMLRMIDIPTYAVIQWFHGSRNQRFQMNSCLTPCGGILLSCSEDGLVCAWDSNTGIQLGLYNGLIMQSCSAAVTYHPHEHMMAVICYQNYTNDVKSQPLSICNYNRCSSGETVGLKIFQIDEYKSGISNCCPKENQNKSDVENQTQSDDLWQKLEALSIERTKELHLISNQGTVYFSTPKPIQDKETSKSDGSILNNKKEKRKKLFSDKIDNSWSKMSKISGFLVDKSITPQKNNESQNTFKGELNNSYDGDSFNINNYHQYKQIIPCESFGGENDKSNAGYHNSTILLDVLKRMDKVIYDSTVTADSKV